MSTHTSSGLPATPSGGASPSAARAANNPPSSRQEPVPPPGDPDQFFRDINARAASRRVLAAWVAVREYGDLPPDTLES